MNVLPRYLYLFQCLSIFLPISFFRSIESIISSFLWAAKQARVNKTFLERKRSVGGLGLPNLLGYYRAANVQNVLLWFISPQLNWCQTEASSCSSLLQALICSTLPLSPSNFTSNVIVINTIKIWTQIRCQFGWLTLPQASPICNNYN